MADDELLKKILETQNKQLAILGELLEQDKSNNEKYGQYLATQKKSNEEYRQSLENSSEDAARKDANRLKEHEAYIRGAKVARITNYVRTFSALVLLVLVGYIAFKY